LTEKGGRLATPAPNQTTQTTTIIRRQTVLNVQKNYLSRHIFSKSVSNLALRLLRYLPFCHGFAFKLVSPALGLNARPTYWGQIIYADY